MSRSTRAAALLLGLALPLLAGCDDDGNGPDDEPGAIRVQVTTSGLSPDPDGYTVFVDGEARGPVPATGSRTVEDVAEGTHLVGLGGIAGNCTVSGQHPRQVAVDDAETTTVSFAVSCQTPGGATGSVEVSVTTNGTEIDPDGYVVTVGSAVPQPIAVEGAATVTAVPAGEATVTLGGLAANCSAADNPQTVTVPEGGTAQVEFTVTCLPTTGGLQVTTTTTGQPQVASYVVQVAGPTRTTGHGVQPNGQIVIGLLEPGATTVTLTEVGPGCTVTSPNPMQVTIEAGVVVALTFEVSCGG